jgi:hypothetical protein
MNPAGVPAFGVTLWNLKQNPHYLPVFPPYLNSSVNFLTFFGAIQFFGLRKN